MQQSGVTAGRGVRQRDGQCPGQGSWVNGEKGLPSPSGPQLSCSSFGPGLRSLRTFYPRSGGTVEGRMLLRPALLPVPAWVSLGCLEPLVVAFPPCSSTNFLLFHLSPCHVVNGCRAHIVLGHWEVR